MGSILREGERGDCVSVVLKIPNYGSSIIRIMLKRYTKWVYLSLIKGQIKQMLKSQYKGVYMKLSSQWAPARVNQFYITPSTVIVLWILKSSKTTWCRNLDTIRSKSIFESCIKPNLDCNYTFTIELTPNRIQFGVKSIGESVLAIQIWFDLTKFRYK